MTKVEEIFKSWAISFNPTDAQAEKAAARIQICDICEHKKEGTFGPFCSLCGCPLRSKIYTPLENACPLKKW
jgi:hypothetical protein